MSCLRPWTIALLLLVAGCRSADVTTSVRPLDLPRFRTNAAERLRQEFESNRQMKECGKFKVYVSAVEFRRYTFLLQCATLYDTPPPNDQLRSFAKYYAELASEFSGQIVLRFDVQVSPYESVDTHVRIPEDLTKAIDITLSGNQRASFEAVLSRDSNSVVSPLHTSSGASVRFKCPCDGAPTPGLVHVVIAFPEGIKADFDLSPGPKSQIDDILDALR